MSTFVVLLVLLAAVVILWLASSAVLRWPAISLFAIGVFAAIAWEIPDAPTIVSFGGVAVKPEDAVAVVLFVAILRRPKKLAASIRKRWPWFALIALCLVLSTVMGLAQFGPSAANEARGTIWLFIAVAWVLAQDWAVAERAFQTFSVVTGLVLIGLFAYHAARYGLGAADSFVVNEDGVEQTGRPLVSGQAMTLALVGFYLILNRSRYTRGRVQLLGAAFLVVAILCQHRSVWLAIAAGLLVYVFSLRGAPLARTVIGGFFGFVVFAILWFSDVLDALFEQIEYALSSDGTIGERQNSWLYLVDESLDRGTWSVLFGEPFGFGYDRVVDGGLITYNPHNWYVVLYLRLGLVGLILTAGLVLYAMVRLIGRGDSTNMLMILGAIATYAWFYHLAWYLAPWLGVALYSAFAARKAGARQSLEKSEVPERREQTLV